MQFKALARYVKTSPTKLRPIADVVRGKNARYALDWLTVYETKKSTPLRKAIQSAVGNAKDLQKIEGDLLDVAKDLHIAEIKVDQGPAYKYYKPGAMGRSKVMRKRLSHISVILKSNS